MVRDKKTGLVCDVAMANKLCCCFRFSCCLQACFTIAQMDKCSIPPSPTSVALGNALDSVRLCATFVFASAAAEAQWAVGSPISVSSEPKAAGDIVSKMKTTLFPFSNGTI